MGSVSSYPSLQWLLALNTNLVRILNIRYAQNQGFFPYVDGLASHLKGKVRYLQEKAVELGNLQDFDSFVSELRFAVALSTMGKQVNMITTPSWRGSGRVPDFECIDKGSKIFFEAKRATEGEGTTELTSFLQQYLRQKPYEVTAEVNPKMTSPTNNPKSRIKRRRLATESIQRLQAAFPCPDVITRYARFETTAIQGIPGYSNILCTFSGDFSIKKYFRFAARKAAEKRMSWQAAFTNTPYVAAIENEESGAADDVTVSESFLGPRLTGGAFSYDSTLRNLSGVLLKNGSSFYFIVNSHAYRAIRPRGFNQFLPTAFKIPWKQTGGYLF